MGRSYGTEVCRELDNAQFIYNARCNTMIIFPDCHLRKSLDLLRCGYYANQFSKSRTVARVSSFKEGRNLAVLKKKKVPGMAVHTLLP